jgi:predicted nucleic acid-binding Zn ribbon protein
MKRPKGAPVGIRQALNGVLSEAGLSHLLHEETLRKNWASLMGPRASSMASLESLKGWVLRIRVESATWRNELNFQRETLRARANEILGADLVRDVVLY